MKIFITTGIVFLLFLLPISFSQRDNITEYIPPVVIYHNETVPIYNNTNTTNVTDITIYHDVRVVTNIINITENRTSFETEFVMFGDVVEERCRLSNIGEEDEHGQCIYEFPTEMWDDFVRYKLVPLPVGEIERNNEHWNQSLMLCERSRKTRGVILLITYIFIPITVIVVLVYLRVRKYRARGR